MELDDTRRAILDAAGHLLIEGGPGSGKTTIALLKAARKLESLEPEQRVVFLSFSRAAVRQISDRVAEHLPRAVRDRLEIRTFHAFFMDFVRAHGPLLTGVPAVFLPPDAENPRKADHDGDWEAETRELARRGTYVFDQLAPVTATLLERSPALRRLYSDVYPLVIVDEFQDTNLDQWRAIQALAQASTTINLANVLNRIVHAEPEWVSVQQGEVILCWKKERSFTGKPIKDRAYCAYFLADSLIATVRAALYSEPQRRHQVSELEQRIRTDAAYAGLRPPTIG